VTTDLHNQCTERHTGTSASAPLAAGIIALALEKNPKLSWRDVQHIVVHTANWVPLKGDPDWRMNGIGLHVNEKFGFGLLDAEKMVKLADPSTYKTVPAKKECRGKTYSSTKTLQWDQPLQLEIDTNACTKTKNELRYVEQIQLYLSIDYTRRGDLTIFLTSPMGTRSCLLPVRGEDSSDEGFRKWPFMTTHAWGEDPRGKWILEIKDGGESRRNTGFLKDWQLVIHGTKTKPAHQNITHPDIPIHKKAVLDDVKKMEKSSVQITQITYTFNTPSSPPSFTQPDPVVTPVTSYSAKENEIQPNLPPPPSPYQQQQPPSNIPTNNRVDFTQSQQPTFPFTGVTAPNNKFEEYNTRTNVPSYPPGVFANYAAMQQASAMGYGQRNVVQQPNYAPLPYTDTSNGNLWDFFGRVNGRRSVESEYYADQWSESNSFVQLLRHLEGLNRNYV